MRMNLFLITLVAGLLATACGAAVAPTPMPTPTTTGSPTAPPVTSNADGSSYCYASHAHPSNHVCPISCP